MDHGVEVNLEKLTALLYKIVQVIKMTAIYSHFEDFQKQQLPHSRIMKSLLLFIAFLKTTKLKHHNSNFNLKIAEQSRFDFPTWSITLGM